MTQEHDSTTYVNINNLISFSTYTELLRVIYRTLLNDMNNIGENYNIKFLVQNDLWETEWRQRSKIPLGLYKER